MANSSEESDMPKKPVKRGPTARKPAPYPAPPGSMPPLPSETAWKLYELALEYHRQEQLAVQTEKAKHNAK